MELPRLRHRKAEALNMDRYSVRQIPGGVGKSFIRQYHYSHSCHNGPMCWGLFDGDELIGVCAFATPGSENVRRSVFGPGRESEVTELHRLVVLDVTPKNTESWFVARAMRGLLEYRPNIRAILSFADETEGHRGVIYQALNAIYCGTTGRSRFWRDPEGRLRHPRQGGHNVTPEEASEMGWVSEMRDAKHRYLFLVGSKTQRRASRGRLLLEQKPYPSALKGGS